jgi:heme-degrading monooxygenase HmoA
VDAIARTPDPPYVAVIFTSMRTPADDGYAATAARMDELAAQQPGYLGIESVRAVGDAGESMLGMTVSYWESEEAARAWKRVAEHRVAQENGRERWYDAYAIRIAHVAREYGFARPQAGAAPETNRRSVS